MARQVPVFSAKAIEAIQADHERLRLEVTALRQQVRALANTAELRPYEIGKTDADGITAMSGTTPGSGTVELHRIRADGTLVATGREETCYSSAGDVAGDTWVGILRDGWNRPWAIVEDCG